MNNAWSDVTRRRPPQLSPKGLAARRRRWNATYSQMAEAWRAKGDHEVARFWESKIGG